MDLGRRNAVKVGLRLSGTVREAEVSVAPTTADDLALHRRVQTRPGDTSLDALLLAEAAAEPGFPPGMVNVVNGGRGTGASRRVPRRNSSR